MRAQRQAGVPGLPWPGAPFLTDVLIYGDTYISREMRHEVPLGIPDPFLYVEQGGVRHLQVPTSEVPRMGHLGQFELHPWEEFGADELVAKGLHILDVRTELAVRAVKAHSIKRAIVPGVFPVHLADRLRGEGIHLHVDQEFFDDRRRAKSEAELVGIVRAQRAAEAGMDAARDLLRRAVESGASLEVDGQPLTAERIKLTIAEALVRHDTTCPEPIVSHGGQTAIGHHMGSGQLRPREPILIDLWPRDNKSGCYADMTRTFVVGEVPPELDEWFRLAREAMDRALERVHAGASTRGVYDAACDVFEAEGHATARTKEPGVPLLEGFRHALGHGVGLDVHEEPLLGRQSHDTLRTGDVITIEPGLYRAGFGGLRLEDLFVVTTDGVQTLTRYPYSLQP